MAATSAFLALALTVVRAETLDDLSPEQVQTFGLNKLSKEERHRLNAWLEHRIASVQLKVEQKFSPEIHGSIRGDFNGWTGHTLFVMQDGQVWEQSQPDRKLYPTLVNASVTIKKDTFGYMLTIAGQATGVRVRPVGGFKG